MSSLYVWHFILIMTSLCISLCTSLVPYQLLYADTDQSVQILAEGHCWANREITKSYGTAWKAIHFSRRQLWQLDTQFWLHPIYDDQPFLSAHQREKNYYSCSTYGQYLHRARYLWNEEKQRWLGECRIFLGEQNASLSNPANGDARAALKSYRIIGRYLTESEMLENSGRPCTGALSSQQIIAWPTSSAVNQENIGLILQMALERVQMHHPKVTLKLEKIAPQFQYPLRWRLSVEDSSYSLKEEREMFIDMQFELKNLIQTKRAELNEQIQLPLFLPVDVLIPYTDFIEIDGPQFE